MSNITVKFFEDELELLMLALDYYRRNGMDGYYESRAEVAKQISDLRKRLNDA